MKIAIIGTGRMGKALLKTFYKIYPEALLFAGRDVHRAQAVVDDLKLNLRAVEYEEALQADVIIPTLWFRDLPKWIDTYKKKLAGKILVDITNPFNKQYDDFVLPYDTSSAEEIQKMLPETTVVGAFKNTYWVVFDDPYLQGLKSDIFLTSDNANALHLISDLIRPLPFRVLNAGKLKNNRTIERMTLLSREVAINAGTFPKISFNLWGLEHDLAAMKSTNEPK